MTEFLARLRQRKLVQWAIAYVAFAFALIQVLDVVSDSYHWPDSAMHIVFGLLVLGFVVTVIVAWYHGERGAQRISGPELLLIALALAIGGGLLWHFVRVPAMTAPRKAIASTSRSHAALRTPGSAASAATRTILATASNTPVATAAFDPPADSIVVLPFANLSGDKSQQYFSDGTTEELTSALGQNTGLTVIAWETASRFADSRQTPQQIGKALNVAQVLGGSIQREGNEVRVSVELVSTVTGRQLWSAHYDDSMKNIFAVEDNITAAIAAALKVKFAGMQAAPTLNPEAHELYLKGAAALNLTTAADAQVAQNYFQQALKLDPNYANAWAGLAGTWLQLTLISTLPLKEALPKIRATAAKALALDPHNVHALLELGNADALDRHRAQAKAEYQQALALDPSYAIAHVLYALVLPLKQKLAQYQEGVLLDPDSVLAQLNLDEIYQELRNWPRMVAAAQAAVRLSPHLIDAAFDLAFAYTEMHRGKEAVKAFDLVHPATAEDKRLVDAGRLTYQALLQPSLRPKALAALGELRRTQTSQHAQHLVMQLYLALGAKDTALEMLAGFCSTFSAGCGDLAISPEYAPLHGDPRFEKLSKQYTTLTLGTATASASSR